MSTVIGVAAALALVVVFAGMRDTVADMLDNQFTTIDLSDGQLLATDAVQVRGLLGVVRADPEIASAEPIQRVEVALSVGDHRCETLLVSMDSETTLHRFFNRDGQAVALPSGHGVLLGDGLRSTLHASVGDTVTIVVAGTGLEIREPIAAFVNEPMASIAYISANRPVSPTDSSGAGLLIRFAPGVDQHAAGHRLSALPGAAAWSGNRATEATLRDAFAIMDVLVGVMFLFAVVLAGALLFNAMSANIAERLVELGTLRAAGLSSRTIRRTVAVENLLLTVAALPLGLVVGTFVARWFMGQYENLGYRWSLSMRGSTYLWVVAGVLFAAAASQLVVGRRVKHIEIAKIVRERSL